MILCKINILFCVIWASLQLFINRSMLVLLSVFDEVDCRFIDFSILIKLDAPCWHNLFLSVALQRNTGKTDIFDIFPAFQKIDSFDLNLGVVVESIFAHFCVT